MSILSERFICDSCNSREQFIFDKSGWYIYTTGGVRYDFCSTKCRDKGIPAIDSGMLTSEGWREERESED